MTGDLIQLPKNTPGPIYNVHDHYKYKESSKWPFGKAQRPPIYTNEFYEHYKHKYSDIEVVLLFRNMTFLKHQRNGIK